MAHFYPQGLLLLILSISISECKDSSPVTEIVFAIQEEDAVLPCFNSNVMDPKSCYRVKWKKYATNASQTRDILAWPNTSKSQDAKRVKWGADENGQMSLFLTKLQKSDVGLYSCEIWQGWDCFLVKNISLRFKECKSLPAVKAAPSTPVNLNCLADTTSAQQRHQNISWAVLKGGNPESVNSKRVKINGTSLAIQSVNYSDSGWYRCKYLHGQTQRCFEINLLVQQENAAVATTVPGLATSAFIQRSSKEGSSGAFIAVVPAVIIGIVIIAALIGLFIYHRRNTQRVTQQTRRPPAGTFHDYEIVSLPPLDDPSNQRVNSLYDHFTEESICTFQY